MTSRIWMSWRIQYLLTWRCDLWRTIVCLRLPFRFLSVSRLSLVCFLSLSFSSLCCLFLILYMSVSFSSSLVSVSTLLTHYVSSSPSLICRFVFTFVPHLGLRLFVPVSASLSPPPSLCLCLFAFLHHLSSLPHRFTAHLSYFYFMHQIPDIYNMPFCTD